MSTILALALAFGPIAQAQPTRPDGAWPRIPVVGLGERQAFRDPTLLMRMANWEPVLAELKATPEQRARLTAITQEARQKTRRIFADPSKSQVEKQRQFEAHREETFATLRVAFDPARRVRLDQLRLWVQGASAFTFPDLPDQLKITPEQAERIGAIVDEGAKRMEHAGSIDPTWPAGAPLNTLDDVKARVGTPEFRAAKARAWREFFEARAEMLRQVEATLTIPQRDAYQALLGPPYDPATYWTPSPDEPSDELDIRMVINAFGLRDRLIPQGGGQRADPNFDTKVAKPAYSGDKHPKVLFDEAHHNFHTASGRYKAFADLISSDGYKVTPNREPFTASSLAGSDILVIANALGAEGMGHPDAAKSAFTDAESDAVRDWVEAGGSLLLITDHQPFGDAADALAKRFGVDMSKGVTTDPVNDGERGLLFSREKGLIGDHAITRGRDDSERVDRVLTFTGQSLKGPSGSVPFLKFSDSAVDQKEGDPVSAAGRAQGIAFSRGKGRVVVMGEAAQLSAQVFGLTPTPMGMNVPGSDNRRMALNTMHWLSRLID